MSTAADLEMEEENQRILLEIHREQLCSQINTRRLLDRMRSQRVFTKDECEEILNEMVNPNSSTKAGSFLDHLQRKGQYGYRVFLQVLGEMYPESYESLTGHLPEAPSIDPTSTLRSVGYTLPNKVGDVIGDLTQEAEELHRKLDFCNQARTDQERKIQSLTEALEVATKKAGMYDKLKKAKRRAENKVSVLEDDIRTILGNSLRHKEERDQAMASLRERMKDFHELQRRLQQAEDQAEVRRQIWHKTCMDKQQLKVDREEMLQRMSTMQEELKLAKRNEDVRKSINMSSNDSGRDEHVQATINILEEELQDYKEKSEELADSLLQARNELHWRDTELEKCKSENEELKQKESSVVKMTELFKTQYNVTWQELIRVKQQRNKAIDERDQAQMDAKAHLAELHKQQELIHAQLQNLQGIHLCPQCSIGTTQQVQTYLNTEPLTENCRMDAPMEYTGTISPDLEEDSPSPSPDLAPRPRSRANAIAREAKITDKVIYNENTFPQEFFSYAPGTTANGESTAGYPWLQRHHSDTIGDSRKVHPGSVKMPHLLSLFNDSYEIDDEDSDTDSSDIESGDEQPKKGRLQELTSYVYNRSQSCDNLLYSKPPSDTHGRSSKRQQTSSQGSDGKDLDKSGTENSARQAKKGRLEELSSSLYRRSQSWDNLVYSKPTSDTMQDT
ncbi:caspase recruitment domain-containing protein 11-like [Acanthaster planci]|uniref:Caspase recruitment domain-containing protein 11-like n=1 Tax=Acanthaster planci TaxID=133434 RepID=A0A8B7ZET4_ACAPL|nr:caspase recruitment domain-containing protein 11-like [Acanthaster planci]